MSGDGYNGSGNAPGNTVVTEKAFGQAETAGVSNDYSRADHTHGTPPAPAIPAAGAAVVTEQAYGQAPAVGVAATFSRSDHSHGTPGMASGAFYVSYLDAVINAFSTAAVVYANNNEQNALAFRVFQQNVTVTGIRFYWGGAVAYNISCKLWSPAAGGTLLASVVVPVNGIGYYTGVFNTPQVIGPQGGLWSNGCYRVSFYENTGAKRTYYAANNLYNLLYGSNAQNAFPISPYVYAYMLSGWAQANDNYPNTSSANTPLVEPVIA